MPPHQLTIIIPTLDRPEAVLSVLKALTAQTISSYEVIVLDQSDDEDERIKEFRTDSFSYLYHYIEEKGSHNARNVAASLAHGDILLFLDDDVKLEKDLVKNYLHLFDELDESFWIIGGRIHERGSRIFNERRNIVGGRITIYGKTLKNFSTSVQGECEWVAGGNFAVRRPRFLQVGGFDKNFIGNAMLEDADFSYRIRKAGGKVFYSPRPRIEHLRIPTGGTRTINKDKAMFYRAHNSVYFFRKHKPLWQLPLVFLYLNGVAAKDFIRRKHSILAVFQTWLGFIRGFATPIK